MKLLYEGPLWVGSTSLQRATAFAQIKEVDVVLVDTGARVSKPGLWNRVRWRLRWPADMHQENQSLLKMVVETRPDVVFVDNSKVISKKSILVMRAAGVRSVVYYSPDDLAASHNLSFPLRQSLPMWDIVFTTKTFNISELKGLGVRRPILVGKAFDPEMHYPIPASSIGPEFESFQLVFIGSYERQRCTSINALAEAGFSVVVFGSNAGGWTREDVRQNIELRPAVFGAEYRRAWHLGRVALCFLKKRNRDRITQRTVEIAAMGRPMLAEKTDEHDKHFHDGIEYVGFTDDAHLIEMAKSMLGDDGFRVEMGIAARNRCITSGYSTVHRAAEMIEQIEAHFT